MDSNLKIIKNKLFYNNLLLFKNTDVSIYTGDHRFRFIKDYYNGDYILGTSEELLVYRLNYKPEVISRINIPGLVDIKDLIIYGNYIFVLSGLRDSVYIFNKDLNGIVLCFNVSKDNKIELFKDRQVQCNEIPNTYFQVFYCPGLNNYHKFNKLNINADVLSIISEENNKSFDINLSNFFSSIFNRSYVTNPNWHPEVKELYLQMLMDADNK